MTNAASPVMSRDVKKAINKLKATNNSLDGNFTHVDRSLNVTSQNWKTNLALTNQSMNLKRKALLSAKELGKGDLKKEENQNNHQSIVSEAPSHRHGSIKS